MVRFHWHVEDGSGASIPHGGMAFHADTAVQHIRCSIEVPGEPPAQAIITVPRGYLSEGQVKEIGILLGHDTPDSWEGPLLTGIAVALAEAGVCVCVCQWGCGDRMGGWSSFTMCVYVSRCVCVASSHSNWS